MYLKSIWRNKDWVYRRRKGEDRAETRSETKLWIHRLVLTLRAVLEVMKLLKAKCETAVVEVYLGPGRQASFAITTEMMKWTHKEWVAELKAWWN